MVSNIAFYNTVYHGDTILYDTLTFTVLAAKSVRAQNLMVVSYCIATFNDTLHRYYYKHYYIQKDFMSIT